MPRVKRVKSLADICMNFILKNQEIFSERFSIGELEVCRNTNALDSDKPSTNPFDDLPTELLEELVRLLRKKESYRWDDQTLYPTKTYKITPFLKLMMTPRLRTLDLTRIKKECISDCAAVLYLATMRIPHLETLILDCQYVTSFHFISKFAKLLKLHIFSPENGDECFELIGKHCPDLRELTCSSSKVTDDGILKLCVVGNCKSIRLLSISRCCKVTTKGIQLALDNLPQLSVLEHECLLECLAEIAQNALDHKLSLPKYSLKTLYILRDTIYKTGSLQKSVSLCPDVIRVYLTMWRKERFDNSELLSLLSLEKLYTIEIINAEFEKLQFTSTEIQINRGLTFDGVVPLLEKFGRLLKSLEFRDFYAVDIAIIIESCPNLESLTIYNCKTNQSTWTKFMERPSSILRHLKMLCLCYLTFENVFTLFLSPSLSRVIITSCYAVTDHVLQSAASLHSFCNLEYLQLIECQSVTKKGIIDIFLKESNPLRKMILYENNSGYTPEDVDDLNEKAIWIKNNWQFKLILHRSSLSRSVRHLAALGYQI